jgi:hypothetical protein
MSLEKLNIKQSSQLKIGQFYIKDNLISPLTQTELSEGWRLKLPNKKKNINDTDILLNATHHFTINLLQLPPYLWKKLKFYNTTSDDTIYNLIKDKNYEYSVLKTEHDEYIYTLYNEIFSNNKKKLNLILEIYNYLKTQNINLDSWLMIYTKQLFS